MALLGMARSSRGWRMAAGPPASDLPGAGARAGGVEQRRAERAEQGGIAGVLDQLLHRRAGGGEELGGEIGLLHRSGRRRLGGGCERVLGDPGDVASASAGVPNSR